MDFDKVAILDCGGQYTKVIDRKIRERMIKSSILPLDVSISDLKGFNGIILSGGPGNVWSDDAVKFDLNIFDLNIPILGICYGLQLINKHFGGTVSPGIKAEYGETDIEIDNKCILFDGLQKKQRVLMSHGDTVDKLAENFSVSGKSENVVASIYNSKRNIYGVQFHPEVDLTVNGNKMMDNFLFKVCNLKGNYTLDDRIDIAIEKIKDQVKDEKILALVSGGVDSAVSAALLTKALKPENVYAIHIDNGLMRKNESDLICENLKKLGLKNLIRENAEDVFLDSVMELDGKKIGPLTKTIDPEEKRNLIGNIFVKVVKKKAEELNFDFDKTFWAQGTLRPDLIESGNPDVSNFAHKIKTHHNDVEIIRKARERGLVVETNWDWHKDEVRQVARKLGIDESIASRQPFPGPGLSVRIICNDCSVEIKKDEKRGFNDLLKNVNPGYSGDVVPLRTVGVQGDTRSYRYLALICKEKTDFEWDVLYKLGREIPNKIKCVNRVAYVLNKNKIMDKVKTYNMRINKENLTLLRELDSLVFKKLNKPVISQILTVLLPCGIEGKLSMAIRTFITNDFMTGRPASIGGDIPKESVIELIDEIGHNFKEIDMILYDISSKPPATVEWE